MVRIPTVGSENKFDDEFIFYIFHILQYNHNFILDNIITQQDILHYDILNIHELHNIQLITT